MALLGIMCHLLRKDKQYYTIKFIQYLLRIQLCAEIIYNSQLKNNNFTSRSRPVVWIFFKGVPPIALWELSEHTYIFSVDRATFRQGWADFQSFWSLEKKSLETVFLIVVYFYEWSRKLFNTT